MLGHFSRGAMYAIIQTGSKQYRVKTGDVIHVEKLEAEAGAQVAFSEVVLLAKGDAHQVGQPYVAGAVVRGVMQELVKGPKVINYRYKKRKRYHRKQGHRQTYSQVQITAIEG
jgi:large subunit ribosomal protein L21